MQDPMFASVTVHQEQRRREAVRHRRDHGHDRRRQDTRPAGWLRPRLRRAGRLVGIRPA